MRKLILMVVVAGFVFVSVAQKVKTESKETKVTKTKTEQVPAKDHVCNANCKGGKHVYLHGEKGHVCAAECTKTPTKK